MILEETEKYEEKGAFKASDLGYPFPENAYVVHYTVEVQMLRYCQDNFGITS